MPDIRGPGHSRCRLFLRRERNAAMTCPRPEAVLQALRDADDVLVLVDDLGGRPDRDFDDAFEDFLRLLPSSVRVVARARRDPQFDSSRLLAGGRLSCSARAT